MQDAVCLQPTQPKNSAQIQVHPQVKSLFQVQSRENLWKGFRCMNIQTDRHRYIQTLVNLQIPKTPHGVWCVITEHTNHFPDQRLFVTYRAYSVTIFLYLFLVLLQTQIQTELFHLLVRFHCITKTDFSLIAGTQ